jgi:hypothetical protein
VGRLREAVDAYRSQKGTEQPQAPKPAKRRLPPAERPTEVPGFPLNEPRPDQEIPDFHTMQTAQIVARARQRKVGAQLPAKPIGEPQLRKRSR